ncbi:MAG TPA: FMN-binding protein [Halanaerobiales bacterium]|nr:FMN-binding protein [Halanaerobiales bacterium]
MRKLLKYLLVVIAVFLIIAGGFLFYLSRGLKAGSELVINEPELLTLEDGIYSGSYNGGRWSNEVEVSVEEHHITRIGLIKDVRFSMLEVSEDIFDRVIEEQSLQVDVVSGATVTSKAYLKSIERALDN